MSNQVSGSQPGQPAPDPMDLALNYGPNHGAQSYAGVGLRLAAYCMDVALSVLSVSVPVCLILIFLIHSRVWAPLPKIKNLATHCPISVTLLE